RFDLLALRLLCQLAFPAGHRLLEFVESSPALRRVRVELAAHEAEGIVERAAELGAQPRNSGALLLALRRQPLGVGGESQLDLAQHLLLPLIAIGHPYSRCFGTQLG